MNEIVILDKFNDGKVKDLLFVWEDSVRQTHDFLNEQDIINLKPQVKEAICNISHLICMNVNNKLVAFMGVEENKIEMLFVQSSMRGKGIGKKLVEYAIKNYEIQYVDVNEQNIQGIEFYEHLGFKTFERSKIDEQGNPFPILHMKKEI